MSRLSQVLSGTGAQCLQCLRNVFSVKSNDMEVCACQSVEVLCSQSSHERVAERDAHLGVQLCPWRRCLRLCDRLNVWSDARLATSRLSAVFSSLLSRLLINSSPSDWRVPNDGWRVGQIRGFVRLLIRFLLEFSVPVYVRAIYSIHIHCVSKNDTSIL